MPVARDARRYEPPRPAIPGELFLIKESGVPVAIGEGFAHPRIRTGRDVPRNAL